MKRLTPVLLVEDLDAALPFWTERLGFTVVTEVPVDPTRDPEGQPTGFAILAHGPVEVMLQSRASAEQDAPGLVAGTLAKDGVGLFLEVEGGLAPWLERLAGCDIAVPERRTFYGAHEIGVRTPDGCLVMLAAFDGSAEGGGDSSSGGSGGDGAGGGGSGGA